MNARPTSVAPSHAGLEISDGHRGLRGERPRHDLRQSDRQVVRGLVNELARVDQVVAHVPNERGRSTEPDRAEFQEVPDKLGHAAPVWDLTACRSSKTTGKPAPSAAARS